MGLTRKRDLAAAVAAAALVGYLLIGKLYGSFPPITVWSGISLLGVGAAETAWGRYVRSKINGGLIGDGSGRLHPLVVARTVSIGKASAWVGALMLGWWIGVLGYLLPKRSGQQVAENDLPGVAVAAVSALALIVAALWLQHCCEKPADPPGNLDASTE